MFSYPYGFVCVPVNINQRAVSQTRVENNAVIPIGAGMCNTERIIINQGVGSYAAQVCAIYNGGGYGDWYLPSIYELKLLFMQKNVVGGFLPEFYWSSSEKDSDNAYSQNFGSDLQINGFKSNPFRMRAIRAF